MLNPNIDLGQLALISVVATIGYFIRKEITTLTSRLDRHDELILGLVKDVQRLIGIGYGHTHVRSSDMADDKGVE